jgi:hypothetical protein
LDSIAYKVIVPGWKRITEEDIGDGDMMNRWNTFVRKEANIRQVNKLLTRVDELQAARARGEEIDPKKTRDCTYHEHEEGEEPNCWNFHHMSWVEATEML